MTRKLESEATALLDGLLAKDPLAAYAIANKLPRQLLAQAAKACLGIREEPRNSNRGREVELFQKTVGLSPGEPWCMAFVQTCIAYAELKIGMPSPVFASGSCIEVWNGTTASQRVVQIPLAGAVAIWQHTKNPDHGHTGVVLDCDQVSFHAIEGNTSDGYNDLNGTVGQTGDGVGFTHRRLDLFNPQKGDMQLRGFLKPF